jgi:hypothetical protein
MLIHSVYFWLKPDLTDAQRADFLTALKALEDVPSVKHLYSGTPAGVPDRPVVDKSFDFSITCVFDNLAAHNAYQVHPLHTAFIAVGKPLWTRVQIYDAD